MEAIIVAAGRGQRLSSTTPDVPKTLLPFGTGTILSRILGNLHEVGIDRFRIVTGFQGERIKNYLRSEGHFGLEIELVENREWSRGNGLSVLAGGRIRPLDGPALLSMSDHLVPPRALRRMIDSAGDKNLLLVDRNLQAIFDMDDATKVALSGQRITAIGKELTDFDAVDCGIFRINERMLEAIESNAADGRESISDAVQSLLPSDDFDGVDSPEDCAWIDVDTPEAYRHALDHRDLFI